EAARRIEVFFYGLFMDADALREKGLDPRNARQGRVPGMGLRIGKRASLTPSPSETSHGMVMQLTHAQIHRLYSDVTVAMSRPDASRVELADGTGVPALCFNLPMAPGPEETDRNYAERLRLLARCLGLPGDYP